MRAISVYNRDMDIDITSLTITQAMQDEELRLELTPACYRQIERLNPILNAFITIIPPSTAPFQVTKFSSPFSIDQPHNFWKILS